MALYDNVDFNNLTERTGYDRLDDYERQAEQVQSAASAMGRNAANASNSDMYKGYQTVKSIAEWAPALTNEYQKMKEKTDMSYHVSDTYTFQLNMELQNNGFGTLESFKQISADDFKKNLQNAVDSQGIRGEIDFSASNFMQRATEQGTITVVNNGEAKIIKLSDLKVDGANGNQYVKAFYNKEYQQAAISFGNESKVRDYIQNSPYLQKSGLLGMKYEARNIYVTKLSDVVKAHGGKEEEARKAILDMIASGKHEDLKNILPYLEQKGFVYGINILTGMNAVWKSVDASKKLTKMKKYRMRARLKDVSKKAADSANNDAYQGYLQLSGTVRTIKTTIRGGLNFRSWHNKMNRKSLEKRISKARNNGNFKRQEKLEKKFEKLYGKNGRVTKNDKLINKINTKLDAKQQFNKFKSNVKLNEKGLYNKSRNAVKNKWKKFSQKHPKLTRKLRLPKRLTRAVRVVTDPIGSIKDAIRNKINRFIRNKLLPLLLKVVVPFLGYILLAYVIVATVFLVAIIIIVFFVGMSEDTKNEHRNDYFGMYGTFAESAVKIYKKAGLTDGVIAGILGNMYQESGVNPYASTAETGVEDESLHVGIFQWDIDGRFETFAKWCEENGYSSLVSTGDDGDESSEDTLSGDELEALDDNPKRYFKAQVEFSIYEMKNMTLNTDLTLLGVPIRGDTDTITIPAGTTIYEALRYVDGLESVYQKTCDGDYLPLDNQTKAKIAAIIWAQYYEVCGNYEDGPDGEGEFTTRTNFAYEWLKNKVKWQKPAEPHICNGHQSSDDENGDGIVDYHDEIFHTLYSGYDNCQGP